MRSESIELRKQKMSRSMAILSAFAPRCHYLALSQIRSQIPLGYPLCSLSFWIALPPSRTLSSLSPAYSAVSC